MILAGLLAKPAVAGTLAFLRSVPREVWYALVLGLVAWWAYDTVYDRGAASREFEIANLTTMLETERAANDSNMTTIAKLVAENQAWAAAAKVQEEQAAKAVASVRRERDALAAELAQRRKNRGNLYRENEQAAAWGGARVHPAVADQLRE